MAKLCGVRARPPAPGVSPDPNSAKAESYVTSNGAEKQKEEVLAVTEEVRALPLRLVLGACGGKLVRGRRRR